MITLYAIVAAFTFCLTLWWSTYRRPPTWRKVLGCLLVGLLWPISWVLILR